MQIPSLEDILSKTLELREQGLDFGQIANSSEIWPGQLITSLGEIYDAIEVKFNSTDCNASTISRQLGISEETAGYYINHFSKLISTGVKFGTLPEAIKGFRNKMRWSQQQFAYKAGTSQTFLSSLENKNTKKKSLRLQSRTVIYNLIDLMISYNFLKPESNTYQPIFSISQRQREMAKRNADLLREMVSRGCSQSDIGSALGIPRQRILQYLKERDTYDKWLTNSTSAQLSQQSIVDILNSYLNNGLQRIANGVIHNAITKAEQEGYGEAVSYYFSKRWHGNSRTTLEKLIVIVKAFKEAQEGVPLDYKKLERKLNLSSNYIKYNLLLDMGLVNIKRRIRSSKVSALESEEMLERGYDLPFTSSDLQHYLGIDHRVVSYHFRKIRKRLGRDRNVLHNIKKFDSFGKNEAMNYRDLSMTYKEYDSGLSKKGICKMFRRSSEFVDYALEKRPFYEPQMVRWLRRLTKNMAIDKGYL